MSKRWPFKDPDEVLDYGFDWSPRGIEDDPITSITCSVVSGTIVVDSCAVGPVEGVATGYGTVTWLSGGTLSDPPEDNELLLHAETGSGRVLEQTIKIKIKTR